MMHGTKRVRLRLGSFLMALIIVVMALPVNVFADNSQVPQIESNILTFPRYKDVPDTHWASGVISKWSGNEYDVLQGDGLGNFFPDRGISLGELATILTRTFGYTDKVEVEVTPIWATEYVQKAVAAGIIGKMDKIDASVPVTREQAIRYIALAYHIELVEGETAFSDSDEISAEYKPFVNTFQRLGYVSGKGNNIFDSQAIYTRAEAMQIIENTTSDIIDNSKDGQVYDKTVIIRKPNVTVSNTRIKGNLIIGQITGDIVLDNITVEGKIIILGNANVIIGKYINSIIDEIDIVGDNVNLIVNKESIVENVIIDANNIIISGDGTVETVTVTDKSKKGVKVLTVPTWVTVDENAGEVKTKNGAIKPGMTGKTSKPTAIRNNDRIERDGDYDIEPERPQPKPPTDKDGVYSITNVIKASSDSLVFEVSNEKGAELQVKMLSDVTGTSKDWTSGTLLSSGRVSISDKKEMESVEVTFLSTLPQYFVVVANLVDEYGRDLCDPLVSIEFTDAYAQFQAKTVDDFEEEKVVQLEKSNDNNFMVANDEVTKVEAGEDGANHITPSGENTYKFENINYKISNLKVGDKIVTVSEDGENIYLIKVAEVKVDGTNATVIAEKDTVLADFFDYVKINQEKDIDKAILDMSEASPGVEYIPNIDYEYASMKSMAARNSTYGLSIIDVNNVTKVGISSKLFVTNDKKNLELSGTITNKLKLTVKIQFDIYLLGANYFEVKVATGLESDVKLSLISKIGSGNYEKDEIIKDVNEITIGRVIFPFGITGLSSSAKITIPIDVELSGSLNAVAKVDLESGFSYNSKSGGQKIDKKKFSSTADLTAKAKVSWGPKLAISVDFLEDMLEVGISANGGIAIEGTAKKILAEGVIADSFHACDTCVEGKIECFAKVSSKATYNLFWKLKGTPWEVQYFDYRRPLLDFYVSLINDIESVHQGNIKAGTGKCPNMKYRTTFDPQDMDKKTIADAVVSVKKDSTNLEVSSGKGRYSTYLYPGDYVASADVKGIILIDQDFTVNKSAQVVIISAQSGSNPGSGGNSPVSGKCGPDLTWVLDVDTGLLTISGTGEMYDWDFNPETFEAIVPWINNRDAIKKVVLDHGVTHIGIRSFSDCINLVEVIIPGSVTSIGHETFDSCTNLENINIPNSVIEIGSAAFRGSGLTSISIPYGVTSIEMVTFYNCKNLKSVVIPDSVTSIDYSAFNNCIELTSIIIPNSVTTIEESAFQNCIGLSSVIIPDSVTSIGQGVFYKCTELKNIIISNSVTNIGNYAFAYTGIESIVIPNSITNISEGLFSGCISLKDVSIPDSVITIGSGAFSFCDGLTSVVIPNSVTNIEEEAFIWCEGLSNIILSNNITNIADETFMGCSLLSSITIPDGVTSIGDRAFYHTNLSSITIPKSVNYIGDEALGYGRKDVYYNGNEDEWNEIHIIDWDSIKYSFEIHYNSNNTYSKESMPDEDFLEEENHEEEFHSDLIEKIPNGVDEEPVNYILEDVSKINRFYGKVA